RAAQGLAVEAARPEPVAHDLLRDVDRVLPAARDLHRRLAAEVADPPLEPAHAGLARVVADEQAQDVLGDVDLRALEPVVGDLPRHEIALRDSDLLVLRVA